ncbi:type II toxin-antitoxin system Phd/YefM family antitoxin [Chamaesiphon sp. VAR_48_metabat_135_sub]|uniref:type II toxin-antitoxin system Phd/YefM family antitoxin n=1 Tax=Chamaesiphon sp. VAR_48_metabat_135_sub TaxID=2964699 RepID=UPI00286BB17C|nr:type II toxin-antitoxin system Phd/YefM family antitoxin [Chamaesiphon sp. VAR_48_metabat_135_sub]
MFSTEITSPTEARAGFFQLIDRVAQSHQVCIINRRDGENVAIIAESDLNSLIETVYLFRSPANARHLLDSIDEYRLSKGEASPTGKLVPQSIEELCQELGIDGEEAEKI